LVLGSLKRVANSNTANRTDAELLKLRPKRTHQRFCPDGVKCSAPGHKEMCFAICIYDFDGNDLVHKF
jgi:hypothetical protein